MATFDASDIDKYAFDFEELASIPDSVVTDMLMAEGEIIKKAQSDSAKAMLQGPYSKGAVAAAPRLGKVRKTQDGKSIYVTFGGKQHGSRLAEIAFLNEFGKHNQAARPFIREANEKHADRAVDAAQKIYDQYLARKGF